MGQFRLRHPGDAQKGQEEGAEEQHQRNDSKDVLPLVNVDAVEDAHGRWDLYDLWD